MLRRPRAKRRRGKHHRVRSGVRCILLVQATGRMHAPHSVIAMRSCAWCERNSPSGRRPCGPNSVTRCANARRSPAMPCGSTVRTVTRSCLRGKPQIAPKCASFMPAANARPTSSPKLSMFGPPTSTSIQPPALRFPPTAMARAMPPPPASAMAPMSASSMACRSRSAPRPRPPSRWSRSRCRQWRRRSVTPRRSVTTR